MFQRLFLFCVFIIVSGNVNHPDIRDGCYYSGDSSVCWEIDDYPAEEIREKLHIHGEGNFYLDFFGDVHAKPFINESTSCNDHVCKTKVKFDVRPQKLVQHGNSCYVVTTENYNQVIRYNICEPSQIGSKCSAIPEIYPRSYSGQCEQKNTMIRLLCYNPMSTDFEAWEMHYPSSCECIIHHEVDYS